MHKSVCKGQKSHEEIDDGIVAWIDSAESVSTRATSYVSTKGRNVGDPDLASN